MKQPRIKISEDSGEADILNWEEFDEKNSLWRYDVLGDLKSIIDDRYEIAKKDWKKDLLNLRKLSKGKK